MHSRYKSVIKLMFSLRFEIFIYFHAKKNFRTFAVQFPYFQGFLSSKCNNKCKPHCFRANEKLLLSVKISSIYLFIFFKFTKFFIMGRKSSVIKSKLYWKSMDFRLQCMLNGITFCTKIKDREISMLKTKFNIIII